MDFVYSAIEWLSRHQFPCFYKQVFGISCPMCGCQRGFWLLVHGNIMESMLRFPPMVAWALSLLLLAYWVACGKTSSPNVIRLLLCNLAVLFANGVYQNVIE